MQQAIPQPLPGGAEEISRIHAQYFRRSLLPPDRSFRPSIGLVKCVPDVQVVGICELPRADIHVPIAVLPQDARQMLVGVFSRQDFRRIVHPQRRRLLARQQRRDRTAGIQRVREGVLAQQRPVGPERPQKRRRVPRVAVERQMFRAHSVRRQDQDVRKGPRRVRSARRGQRRRPVRFRRQQDSPDCGQRQPPGRQRPSRPPPRQRSAHQNQRRTPTPPPQAGEHRQIGEPPNPPRRRHAEPEQGVGEIVQQQPGRRRQQEPGQQRTKADQRLPRARRKPHRQAQRAANRR